MEPWVSVVIPTFNAGPQFVRLLEALGAQTLAPAELVVIDSGSRDGTPERAQEAGARVLTIPPRTFNHGRARNQAIAATRGELVVLTVQDALPTGPTWLEQLCAPLLQDASLAASYGLQLAPEDAPPLARARSLMWERTCPPASFQEGAPPEVFWALPPAERLARARFDDVTACLRRAAWEALPLPEVAYAEDVAWSVQALMRGWRIAWVPQARVWHYHHRSMDYEFRRAFADGFFRARVLRWPSQVKHGREALALWREARRPQLAARYATLRAPAEIRHTLWEKELKVIADYPDVLFVRLYREMVNFSWGLVDMGEALYGAGPLPEGLWPDAAAFATVSIMGTELGLAAAQQRGPFWWALRRYLGRGV